MPDNSAQSLIFVAVITSGIGMLFWMVQRYFDSIHKHLGKLEGHIESLRKDMVDHTKAMILAQSELKALWRYADGNKRASDGGSHAGSDC